jgi:PAS domain S-box-containing protein
MDDSDNHLCVDLTKSLFDLLPLGIIVSDETGRVIKSNRAAQVMLGFSLPNQGGQALMIPVSSLVWADGTTLRPSDYPCARAMRDHCEVVEAQLGRIGPDGELTWLQVTATPLAGVGLVTTYHDVSLGRQAEEDLRHHLEQLDAFFETNLDLLAILNCEGCAVRLNPAWQILLGYDSDRLDGARILDLVHPGDTEATLGALARIRGPKEVVGFVNRIRHESGNYRFLEWRVTARGDLIYATARDITDQRLAEADLRESEARFRAIFEQAAVGVAEIDGSTGKFLRVNQRFCDIIGYSGEEIGGRLFEDITHPEDVPSGWQGMDKFQSGEVNEISGERRYVHKDGRIIWASFQVRHIGDGGKAGHHDVVVIEDITERKDTDEVLRRSLADMMEANQRLSFQVTRMPLAYIVWDFDFRVVEWNLSAERIFGWSAQEAIGQHAFDLIVPLDQRPLVTSLWNGLMEGGEVGVHSTHDNCTRDGRRIACEWFNAPLIDQRGRVVGRLSMVQDVTERQRLEEKVLQSQKVASLGSFAGGLAYDVNAGIQTIMRLAASLRDRPVGAASLASTVESILQACRRGRRVVRGLLDFSHLDHADTKVLDLNELLREQTLLVQRSAPSTVRIEHEFDPRLRPIIGDQGTLAGAFMQLFLNALEAMPDGGVLTVRTRMQGEDEVEIDVDDTGTGMSKEVLAHAMEPFYTTKSERKGAGMGLCAVYGAIRAHQGNVELHSEPGRGTQVHVALPLTPATVAHPSEANPPVPCGLRILLVDDDDLVQTVVRAQLRRLGHVVIIAENGLEAIERLRAGLDVDLLLLDLNMPILDGRKALPRLRELRPHLPVIIETGKLDNETEQLAREYSDVSLLVRPFSLNELKAAIDEHAMRTATKRD